MPDLVVSEDRVKYDSMAFGYGDGETVVEDISSEVGGGETLTLVGLTGGGKSTILELLMCMYDPDGGYVDTNGQDVHDAAVSNLRGSIAYVSRETFLFYGTVHDSITYGTFDADDKAVVTTVKAVKARGFISDLPGGYDVKVGERGARFSGGQHQRVSIAHTILKGPDILVFNEATSDVDTETETLIQRLLDGLMAGRTTFSIAYHLLTVKDAEQVIVLEDGHIVERGAHDDLLSEDGLCVHLWRIQANEVGQFPDGFIGRTAHRQAETGVGDD